MNCLIQIYSYLRHAAYCGIKAYRDDGDTKKPDEERLPPAMSARNN